MNCSKCNIILNDHLLGGTLYHRCPQCEGFWFDKGELFRIRQEKDWFKIDPVHKQAKASVKKSHLKCPRDNETLKTIEYQHETGIKVDVCQKCEGLWLDAGEIQAIHRANETWLGRLKETIEDELTAIELFLIKIGPNIPK